MAVSRLVVADVLHLHLHRAAEVVALFSLAAAHLCLSSLGENPHRGLSMETVVLRPQEVAVVVGAVGGVVDSSLVEANRPWGSISIFVVGDNENITNLMHLYIYPITWALPFQSRISIFLTSRALNGICCNRYIQATL